MFLPSCCDRIFGLPYFSWDGKWRNSIWRASISSWCWWLWYKNGLRRSGCSFLSLSTDPIMHLWHTVYRKLHIFHEFDIFYGNHQIPRGSIRGPNGQKAEYQCNLIRNTNKIRMLSIQLKLFHFMFNFFISQSKYIQNFLTCFILLTEFPFTITVTDYLTYRWQLLLYSTLPGHFYASPSALLYQAQLRYPGMEVHFWYSFTCTNSQLSGKMTTLIIIWKQSWSQNRNFSH